MARLGFTAATGAMPRWRITVRSTEVDLKALDNPAKAVGRRADQDARQWW
jgi:hypothetical protein